MKEKGKVGRVVSNWKEEGKKFFKDRGVELEEVERRRVEDGALFSEIVKKDKKNQRKERWERINNSEFNKWYKRIKGERVPGYLKKGWRESRWRRIVRFRLGKIREGRY